MEVWEGEKGRKGGRKGGRDCRTGRDGGGRGVCIAVILSMFYKYEVIRALYIINEARFCYIFVKVPYKMKVGKVAIFFLLKE